jgi:hypothetical protein
MSESTMAWGGDIRKKIGTITLCRLLILGPIVAAAGTARQATGSLPTPPGQPKRATQLLRAEPMARRTEQLLWEHVRGVARRRHLAHHPL